MDGIAALSCPRKNPRTAGTPVILTAAKVQPDEAGYYMNLGSAAVIAKPFDAMKLISGIEQNWAQYYGKWNAQRISGKNVLAGNGIF